MIPCETLEGAGLPAVAPPRKRKSVKSARMNLWLTQEQKRMIESRAEKEGLRPQEWIRRVLDAAL